MYLSSFVQISGTRQCQIQLIPASATCRISLSNWRAEISKDYYSDSNLVYSLDRNFSYRLLIIIFLINYSLTIQFQISLSCLSSIEISDLVGTGPSTGYAAPSYTSSLRPASSREASISASFGHYLACLWWSGIGSLALQAICYFNSCTASVYSGVQQSGLRNTSVLPSLPLPCFLFFSPPITECFEICLILDKTHLFKWFIITLPSVHFVALR